MSGGPTWLKKFTDEELAALPDLPSADRHIDITCQKCGTQNRITIPGMPQLEVHDSDVIDFWIGSVRYVICKSEGKYYKRRAPL